jgi:hypothetical protein
MNAHWGTCYPSPALAVIIALALALAFAFAFALSIALALVALAFALLFALFAIGWLAIITGLTIIRAFLLRFVRGAATWGRLRVHRVYRGRLINNHQLFIHPHGHGQGICGTIALGGALDGLGKDGLQALGHRHFHSRMRAGMNGQYKGVLRGV